MKIKIFKLLFAFLLTIPFVVLAENNILELSQDDNLYYYDTNKYHENLFLDTEYLNAGEEIENYLQLNNETKSKVDIYLKASQDKYLNTLGLEEVNLKLYFNNTLMFEGTADGLNNTVKSQGDYQNGYIYLGYIDSKDQASLFATIKNPEDDKDTTAVQFLADWNFYVKKDDKYIMIEKKPIKNYNISLIIPLILLILVIVLLIYLNSHKKIVFKKD